MDESLLAQARDYALTGGGSGFIVRSGWLVYTWGNPDTVYDLKSSTKSIGVTALGLAVHDGVVAVDDVAQGHLPTVGVPPESNIDTGWPADITLRQLATHSAGFDKTGGYIALLFQPGSTWAYSDGGANWLADVLTVRFGRDLRTLMFQRVFTPIGITGADLTWRKHLYREATIEGITRREFGAGIRANVDAMARLGYLYLRGGTWNGQPLVPQTFIEQVRRPDPSLAGRPVHNAAAHPAASSHYGLLWWNNGDGTLSGIPKDAFWSWGLRDSLIVVIPSLDIVVARAGAGWRTGWNSKYTVLQPFLEPIVRSANGGTIGPGSGTVLAASGDTFSIKASPDATVGSKTFVRVHGPNEKAIGFVQFDVAGLSGGVTAATLELFVREVRAVGTLEVHPVNAAWREASLSYNNKPPYGATIASLAVTANDVGRTISLDVTTLVQQWTAAPSGAFGVALTSPGMHVRFDSREGANPPAIKVTP
jgi:hypothetical protein